MARARARSTRGSSTQLWTSPQTCTPWDRIILPQLNAYYIGQLFYFFEKAVGISGYMLEVNPFNQPGVEAYKKNMFALLEKPGFEEATQAIKSRL